MGWSGLWMGWRSGGVSVWSGSVLGRSGGVSVRSGGVSVWSGSVSVRSGSVSVRAVDVSVGSGSVSGRSGGVSVWAVDVSVRAVDCRKVIENGRKFVGISKIILKLRPNFLASLWKPVAGRFFSERVGAYVWWNADSLHLVCPGLFSPFLSFLVYPVKPYHPCRVCR